MLTAILIFAVASNLFKQNRLSRAQKGHAVRMKATRLRSAADTRLLVKKAVRLKIQLGQRLADTSFLLVTNLTTNIILDTAYIYGNIEKICFKKDTPKPAGLSPIAIEESDGNAAYLTDKVKSKQDNSKHELNKNLSAAVCLKNLPFMNGAYLDVKRNAQGVQRAVSHEMLVNSRQTFVVLGK